MQWPASVNVKYWLLVFGRVGANDNLLGLRTDLPLKSGEYNAYTVRYGPPVSKKVRVVNPAREG